MAASAAMIVMGARTGFAQTQADGTAPPAGNIALYQQIQLLQEQLQQLQGQLEQLQHQSSQAQRANEARIEQLAARLAVLEGAARAQVGTITTDTGHHAAALPPPADSAAAKKMYAAAFHALEARDYVASARGFRQFIEKYPHDLLTPNAQYWLGESYYATGNFEVALASFQTVLKHYPGSNKAAAARLKLGYCQDELRQYTAARQTLEALVRADPDSAIAELARERLRGIPLAARPH